jgi:hypothetical protein
MCKAGKNVYLRENVQYHTNVCGSCDVWLEGRIKVIESGEIIYDKRYLCYKWGLYTQDADSKAEYFFSLDALCYTRKIKVTYLKN